MKLPTVLHESPHTGAGIYVQAIRELMASRGKHHLVFRSFIYPMPPEYRQEMQTLFSKLKSDEERPLRKTLNELQLAWHHTYTEQSHLLAFKIGRSKTISIRKTAMLHAPPDTEPPVFLGMSNYSLATRYYKSHAHDPVTLV